MTILAPTARPVSVCRGTRPAGARRWRRAGLLAGLAGLGAGPAWAQYGGGVAPAVGANLRTDDLRGQLQQFRPAPLPRDNSPAWRISPSIGVLVGVTDNSGLSGSSGQTDVYTTISPSLLLTGDTSRFRVNLSYAPRVSFYASNSSQNRVDQSFAGSVLATIVPEAVFVDLRGLTSVDSRTGGISQNNVQALNRQDQVQSTSFSVTPYARHRFGGWGTAEIGYSLARTIQDNASNPNGVATRLDAFGQLSPGFGVTGNLTTQRERASFTTGENFGRFNNELTVEAIQYSGFGVYQGAFRNTVNNELGYAVTRTITLLGGVGYQDLRFNSVPVTRIQEPTWNVGTRLAPNADSTITVLYGRHDGFASVSFDGNYSPTARTRLFGRYSTGLTTGAEDQQALLQSTSVGPTGLLVDSTTGVPVGGGGLFGTQNGLSKVRRLSVGASLLLNRDTFSASVSNEDRTTVVNSTSFTGTAVPAGTSTSGTFGSLSWQHELSPIMTSTASVSYGVTSNVGALLGTGSNQSQKSLSFTAGLSRTFTETLTGNVNYLHSERLGGGQASTVPAQLGGNFTQNTLLVGLRKSF